jgi:predicted type IV restriction endonuclease
MKVPEIIEQKVDDFAKNEKSLLDPKFGETETRNRFIDPFFRALGWELEQTHLPRKLWDVHREYSQKDNSSTKKPDYAFRLHGKLKFFVEAKAPWVRIIDNPDKDTMFQAKRYAYSTNGQAPIVIITDFQEFRVFNSLLKPIYDNPENFRVVVASE